jgi:predicted nucleic acid-binding protein
MKATADTSVLVAAFASWHERHTIAVAAMQRVDVVIAHCLLETYSVLTRMPPPHRMDAQTVATYLRLSFSKCLTTALSGNEQRKLVDICANLGIQGGAVYDAVIAQTASRSKLRLLTLDTRARATYAALGVEHEFLT